MPLLNDVGRCFGMHHANLESSFTCDRRETCACYVERNQGGPRTMTYAYLCGDGDDNYIPAEKDRDK